jgi:ABC-2 type transport system ATP-binding protein
MLRVTDLTKTYPGGVRALRGVSFEAPPGMFALLGPNGSGKTTLMKIVATVLDPDSGSVTIGDDDVIQNKKTARRLLGYLPQEFGFYATLTAEQTLEYFAKLKGVIDRKERRALVAALLERVNLSSVHKQRVGEFSGGMLQRLGIAQALIGQPRLLIADEPAAGLDPEERTRFHNLLAEVAAGSTVVILSTHIVSDVSGLCSRMAIIREGEIVVSCTPQEAVGPMAGTVWEGTFSREQARAFGGRLQIISSQFFEGRVRLRVCSSDGWPGEDFTSAVATLEDYYLSRIRPQGRE